MARKNENENKHLRPFRTKGLNSNINFLLSKHHVTLISSFFSPSYVSLSLFISASLFTVFHCDALSSDNDLAYSVCDSCPHA